MQVYQFAYAFAPCPHLVITVQTMAADNQSEGGVCVQLGTIFLGQMGNPLFCSLIMLRLFEEVIMMKANSAVSYFASLFASGCRFVLVRTPSILVDSRQGRESIPRQSPSTAEAQAASQKYHCTYQVNFGRQFLSYVNRYSSQPDNLRD